MPIRPAQFQRRSGDSFPRTSGFGQAHRLGVSKACRVLELWLHGICNSPEGVATACAKRLGSGLACDQRLGLFSPAEGVCSYSRRRPELPFWFHCEMYPCTPALKAARSMSLSLFWVKRVFPLREQLYGFDSQLLIRPKWEGRCPARSSRVAVSEPFEPFPNHPLLQRRHVIPGALGGGNGPVAPRLTIIHQKKANGNEIVIADSISG